MKLRDIVPPFIFKALAAKPRLVPVVANYEAAQWSHNRTTLPAYARSPREDIDAGTRFRLIERARYWEKNSPLVQKILDLMETNIVGTGIHPTPMSSDADWNAAALKAWDQWTKYADLTSRQDFYSLESVIVRAMAVDGEVFVRLVKSENGRPRLQLIEAHRCKSFKLADSKYSKFTDADGILLDEVGRPQFYCFDNENGTAAVIPASEVVHFFEPSRAGQYHGVTIFHASLLTIHDESDLQGYEMLAAKKAASRSDVVSSAGQAQVIDPEAIARGEAVQASSSDSAAYYQSVLGGETVVLRNGDKLEQSKSERPSVVMQGFWDYLDKRVCMGVGISYAAITDYAGNWGGAALRAAIASDNRFYSIRTSFLTAGLDLVFQFVIGSQLAAIGAKAPADWRNVRWQPPARSTVDVGRESKTMIDELRAGIRTFSTVIGEGGDDWRGVLAQRAKEEAFIDELAKKEGIDRVRISSLNPNMLTMQPADAAPAVDGVDNLDTPADATVGSQAEAAAAGGIQDTGLNGAQVQSLVELAVSVANGQLPMEAAKNIARASFPLIPQAQIDGIFRSLEAFKPAASAPAPANAGGPQNV